MHNFEGITPTVANIRPTSRGEINIKAMTVEFILKSK